MNSGDIWDAVARLCLTVETQYRCISYRTLSHWMNLLNAKINLCAQRSFRSFVFVFVFVSSTSFFLSTNFHSFSQVMLPADGACGCFCEWVCMWVSLYVHVCECGWVCACNVSLIKRWENAGERQRQSQHVSNWKVLVQFQFELCSVRRQRATCTVWQRREEIVILAIANQVDKNKTVSFVRKQSYYYGKLKLQRNFLIWKPSFSREFFKNVKKSFGESVWGGLFASRDNNMALLADFLCGFVFIYVCVCVQI